MPRKDGGDGQIDGNGASITGHDEKSQGKGHGDGSNGSITTHEH